MKRRNFSLPVLIMFVMALLSLSVLYSCGANIFSVDDDVTMGKDIDQQIRSDSKQFPIMQGNQNIKDYVSGLGKYVLQN